MKVLVVGGGSGGHVMPAMAVAKEILNKNSRTKIEFWTDRKYFSNVEKVAKEEGIKLKIRKISAGKFRRYAGWTIKSCFEHPIITVRDLLVGNIIGGVRFLFGILQSFLRFSNKDERPDVIFLKGGFVGLPVGLVAGKLKIPYVIHESDATMGLANRLLVKKASRVATGMKYTGNDKRFEWVGIPIGAEYREVSEKRKRELKRELGFSEDKKLVIVTGGSQGAATLNEAVKKSMPELNKVASVGLITGKSHYEEMSELRQYQGEMFRMWDFSFALHEILGAADLVVSRAGATTIAELAALKKATIMVPFEKLPGAHQLKNAENLAENNAAVLIKNETLYEHPEKLYGIVKKVLEEDGKCEELAENLRVTAKFGAAKRLAEIIFEVAYEKR